MDTVELRHYADPDAVCVWWEKPERGAGWRYEALLDGRKAGETDKTHFLFSGLAPETEYSVEIRAPGLAAALTVRTPAVRERLTVTDAPYGAVGDGVTMNTAALQRAIDDCPAGGSVAVPEGVFLTGGLRLHSDMELYLERGAVLQGSFRPEDYLPRVKSRFEGTELPCYQSLLNLGELDHASGANCKNVVIRGEGTIRGGGQSLCWAIMQSERARLREYLETHQDYIATCENENTVPGRVRGRLIQLANCENVRISGLTLAEGASWNVHMIYSRGIVTDHCSFVSKGVWNGDGWDPDSSEDCTLFASVFYTEDDSVAIKSGKNPEGNVINRPARRIRVFDCRSEFGHGVCIGSEMSGGVEDVRIWDCDLERSELGVQLKGSKKRGGYIRDVEVRDCVVPRLLVVSVSYNDDGEGAPEPPVFEDLRYERVTVTGRSYSRGWVECPAVELRGFDVPGHALRNVRLRDITITGGTGMVLQHCENLSFENLRSVNG